MQLEGYENEVVVGRVKGVFPQDKQLITLHPTDAFNNDQGAKVGAARDVQWWEPGIPMYCKLVNNGSTPVNIDAGRTVANLITVNCTDKERVHSLFDHVEETDSPPLPSDGVAWSNVP